MSKLYSLLFLFGLSLQAAAATEEEMMAGKTEGQTLGLREASKNPALSASGTFNTTSGVGSYSSMGEPGNGGVAGAKGSNTYSMTVDCNVTRTKYVGGIGVKYGTCALDANANVTAIPFSVCTVSQTGAICGSSDWSSYQTVVKGGSKTFAGGKVVIKITSCSYSTCQVSLVDNDEAAGTGASLNAEGQESVNAEGEGGLAGQQTSVYENPLYHGAMLSATNQSNCYDTNVSQAIETEGKVYTCDGQQSASVDPGCTTVTECLQQSTTTRTWTETCEAEVPLTTKTCTTKTPTKDCEEEMVKQDFSCAKSLTVEVSGSYVSTACSGAQVTVALADKIYATLYCTAEPGVYTVLLSSSVNHCSGSGRVAAGASATVWCQPVTSMKYRVSNTINCNGPNCTWSGSLLAQPYSKVHVLSNFSRNFQGSSSVMNFTYKDTWENGCSSYESAGQQP